MVQKKLVGRRVTYIQPSSNSPIRHHTPSPFASQTEAIYFKGSPGSGKSWSSYQIKHQNQSFPIVNDTIYRRFLEEYAFDHFDEITPKNIGYHYAIFRNREKKKLNSSFSIPYILSDTYKNQFFTVQQKIYTVLNTLMAFSVSNIEIEPHIDVFFLHIFDKIPINYQVFIASRLYQLHVRGLAAEAIIRKVHIMDTTLAVHPFYF